MSRLTKTETVYRVLRKAIVQGHVRPKEAIREEHVARELSISRTPVRAALARLESEGLIVFDRSGASVRDFSTDEVQDIFYVRELLEGAATELAATRMTAKEIDRMYELLQKMREVNDAAEYVAVHGDFHYGIWQAAQNDHLLKMLSSTKNLLDIMWGLARPELLEYSAEEEHRDLLEAIVNRDPREAKQRARAHVARARDRLVAVLERRVPDNIWRLLAEKTQ